MFGSFLPSLWSSSNQSLLGSRVEEPTLLCNQVGPGTQICGISRLFVAQFAPWTFVYQQTVLIFLFGFMLTREATEHMQDGLIF